MDNLLSELLDITYTVLPYIEGADDREDLAPEEAGIILGYINQMQDLAEQIAEEKNATGVI